MNGLSGSDMTFVLLSAALVMIMVPGLALFYGGMVKSKNVLGTTLQSYAALALISIQWIFIGYTLAFGPDFHGIIGGLDFAFLKNIGYEANPIYAATIPHLEFVVFQMLFAAVTVAVVAGGFAERMRFPAFILFVLFWGTFVYSPVAHWVWGGAGDAAGWLKELGVIDFAGGFVVEINSGVAGLVAALVLGKRRRTAPEPHHLPMAILGGGILWFGWFGFNAGSALAMNGTAINAFLTTNTAAAGGAVAFAACDWLIHKKVTALGTISGAIAGLVSITQGAGFVTPCASLIIGLVGGTISFFAIAFLKPRMGYDDTLDAFGCHGVGGIWGAIATGLFATTSVNPAGANGLFYGNPKLLFVHLIGVVAIASYTALMTFVILKVIGKFVPLRVTKEEESEGLDMAMHGETAYNNL